MTGHPAKIFLLACAAITMSCESDRTLAPSPAKPVPSTPATPATPATPVIPILSAISVSPSLVDLQETELGYLSVALFDQRGQWMAATGQITYSSKDPSIAVVNEHGMITAVAPGQTTITVKVALGTTSADAFMTVTVHQAIVSNELVLIGNSQGWSPNSGHVFAGGVVTWKTGALDWQSNPFTTIWLLDEHYGYSGDSVDVSSGSATRTFDTPGIVRYCTGACWDPPDFGVIYVH